MKKIVLTLILSACGFVLATAQGKPSFGLKAGLNFTEFNGDGSDSFDTSTGFHAGIVLHVPLPKKLGIQAEAMYSVEKIEDVVDLGYLNVPVLLTYKIIPGLRLQVGPQFKIITNADVQNSENKIEDDLSDFNFDGAVGLEYKFPVIGIFAQARYNYGFTDFIDDVDVDAKSNNFQLSVGYRF